ncbi:MAG TPA: hypothetical protein VKZ93_08795 [Arenibacter sp.]|nr:hypothetical protein [Arenibacter sp.]
MKNDKIDELFRDLHGTFNTEEPAEGHSHRFLAKLESATSSTGTASTKNKKSLGWPLSIAASLLLLCTLAITYLDLAPTTEQQITQISPEISNTGNYFGSLIRERVKEMQNESTPATEKMIADTMIQLRTLDDDYKKMEQDLLNGGNSKLILSAMINNFQMRIDLLNDILERIEEIKTLKKYQDENVSV